MVSDTATQRPKAAKTTPLKRRRRGVDDATRPTPTKKASPRVDDEAPSTVSIEKETSSTPTTPDAGTPRLSTGRGALRRLLSMRVLVGAVLVALIAATGFFGYHYFTDGSDDATVSQASRTQAIDTATKYAVQLSSFDYRDLNKNRESITAMSTPDFAKKYSEMVTALSQIVTDGKGQASATAPHVAIERIDADTATVILFVDQKATNVVSPNGKSQPYRMVITMKHSGDSWLVDNVETK